MLSSGLGKGQGSVVSARAAEGKPEAAEGGKWARTGSKGSCDASPGRRCRARRRHCRRLGWEMSSENGGRSWGCRGQAWGPPKNVGFSLQVGGLLQRFSRLFADQGRLAKASLGAEKQVGALLKQPGRVTEARSGGT